LSGIASPVFGKYFVVGHLAIGLVAQVSLRLVTESQGRGLVPVLRAAMFAEINGKTVREFLALITDGHVRQILTQNLKRTAIRLRTAGYFPSVI
jgi:hypothetical protein